MTKIRFLRFFPVEGPETEEHPVEHFGSTPVPASWHWVEVMFEDGEWDYSLRHKNCPHWRQYQGGHYWLTGWECPEGWFVDTYGFDPTDYDITEPGEYEIKHWHEPEFYSPSGYTIEADTGLEVRPYAKAD